MPGEIPYVIKGFKGVNLRDPKYFLQETDLGLCKNFDLGMAGELIKRPGWDCPYSGASFASATQILGFFNVGATHQILASTSTKTFYSVDGITWTEIQLAGVSFGAKYAIQYNNKMYLLRGGTVIEWDGAAAVSIVGSPNSEGGLMLKDRMFTFNTFGSGVLGSRITYTAPGDVTATGWTGGGTLDVNIGDGDVICAMVVLQDNLIIFKMHSVWSLSLAPQPADWTLRVLHPDVGCNTKYGVKVIDNFMYFISARAVYKSDGNSWDDISMPIEPIFRDRLYSYSTINTDALAWIRERLIIVLSSATIQPTWGNWSILTWNDLAGTQWGGITPQKLYWVWNLKAQGWTQWVMPPTINPFTFAETKFEAPIRGLYAGDALSTGKIFRLTTNSYRDFDGAALNTYICEMETQTFDFGRMTMMGRIFNEPSHMKRVKWVGIRRFCTSGTMTLTYIIDEKTRADSPVAVLNGAGMSKLRGPGYGNVFRFNVKIDSVDFAEFHEIIPHILVKRTVIANTG